MYILKPSLKMTKQEIINYKNLPDNLPESKLTKKQIDFIHSLYRKYLEHKITKGWGTDLYEIERRENWPSGPRVKNHEAKRFILGNLVEINLQPKLNDKKAANKFYGSLTCREAYCILVQSAYELKRK